MTELCNMSKEELTSLVKTWERVRKVAKATLISAESDAIHDQSLQPNYDRINTIVNYKIAIAICEHYITYIKGLICLNTK